MPIVDVFERQGSQRAWSSRDDSGEGSHDEDGDEDGDDDDDDDFGHDALSSAFTNPSWYGSPSMRRDQVAWGSSAATSPASPASTRKLAANDAAQPSTSAAAGTAGSPSPRHIMSAYEMALHRTRHLLLIDMDREADDKLAAATHDIIDTYNRNKAAQSQFRATPATMASPTTLAYAPTDAATFDTMPTFQCATCGITLALQDELISKAFSGRDGKAYLFFSVLNARTGAKEDRQLITGLHTVADLNCSMCDRPVGWTYVRAYEASQRYKEGKYILERASLHKANHW